MPLANRTTNLYKQDNVTRKAGSNGGSYCPLDSWCDQVGTVWVS
jgi:hypothetical protein